jgi:hypothetical protein
MFEVNKYEDDIMNNHYTPRKNAEGRTELVGEYHSSGEDICMDNCVNITFNTN